MVLVGIHPIAIIRHLGKHSCVVSFLHDRGSFPFVALITLFYSFFNPKRSLDPEQILFDCWADGFSFVWRRSGLRRERTRNKMPTRKWKMTGSYLLHKALHHNGLMTDLGLTPNILWNFYHKRAKCLNHSMTSYQIEMTKKFYPILSSSSLAFFGL